MESELCKSINTAVSYALFHGFFFFRAPWETVPILRQAKFNEATLPEPWQYPYAVLEQRGFLADFR